MEAKNIQEVFRCQIDHYFVFKGGKGCVGWGKDRPLTRAVRQEFVELEFIDQIANDGKIGFGAQIFGYSGCGIDEK